MISQSSENPYVIAGLDADRLWLALLKRLLRDGVPRTPRGKATYELTPQLLVLEHASSPVITIAARKLNYGFMVAEAFWILAGRNDLAFLTKYNKRMADFSDDHLTLAGAYGPRIVPQVPYVIRKLKDDPESRQAVLTIWTPSPAPSRDIPCTVSMQFLIRDFQLNAHVTMRSSDAWLGLPYDLFTFSRIQEGIAAEVGVPVGRLSIMAGSSHLYLEHAMLAKNIVGDYERYANPTPLPSFDQFPNPDGLSRLEQLSHLSGYETKEMTTDPGLADMFNVLRWYNNNRDFSAVPSSPLIAMLKDNYEERKYLQEAKDEPDRPG